LLAVALVVFFLPKSPADFKSGIGVSYPDVAWIDAETVSQWLRRDTDRDLVVFDVRSEAEFEVSHLKGARRLEPDGSNLQSLALPTDAVVVVYCSVGVRSAGIVDELEEAGFTEVYNLEGGIFGWANEGRPVFRGGLPVTEVHGYGWPWSLYLRPELRATTGD